MDSCLTYRHIDGEDDIARINALQATFSVGGGGTINLPSPSYSGAGTIALNSGVNLVGCGSGRESEGYGTQITSDDDTVVSMFNRHSSARDINLRSKSNTATVVHIKGGREHLLRDVWTTTEGDQGTGVLVEGGPSYGSYINRLVRVHVAGVKVGIHVYGTLTNGTRRANHTSIRESRTDSCEIGVLADESDSVNLSGHHAEGNTVAGLKIDGRAIRTSCVQCYLENGRKGGVDIDATGTSYGGNGWVKFAFGRHGTITDPLGKVQVI